MLDRESRLTLVRALTGGALVAVLFGPGVVYTGNAEPYLSPPATVFGQIDALLVSFGGFGLLLLFNPLRLFRNRYWTAAAEASGLTPEGWSVLGSPECTGTVRGREVRARIGKNGALTSEDRRRYTVVEAALSGPATSGVVVGPADGGGVTAYGVAASPDAEVDGLVAVSDRDGLASEVLDDRVAERLREVEDLDQLYAGDAKAAGDTLPDDDRVPFGTYPGLTSEVDAAHDDDRPDRAWLGDEAWVSCLSWGTTVDAEQLRGRIDAVVAVADAFDRATARAEDHG